MTEITAEAYGSAVSLTDDTLTIRATSKIGRAALFGPSDQNEVTLPLEQIATVDHAAPKMGGLVNGHLDIRTTDGKRYEVHYRAKKNADFQPLAEALSAAIHA